MSAFMASPLHGQPVREMLDKATNEIIRTSFPKTPPDFTVAAEAETQLAEESNRTISNWASLGQYRLGGTQTEWVGWFSDPLSWGPKSGCLPGLANAIPLKSGASTTAAAR